MARGARIAVGIAVLAGLAKLWLWLAVWLPTSVQDAPLYELSRRHAFVPALGHPTPPWLAIEAALLAIVAIAIAGRRHATARVMFDLARTALIAIGLWLPIASRLWCSWRVAHGDYLDADFALVDPVALAAFAVALPALVAALIVSIGARRRLSRHARGALGALAALAFAGAIASRWGATVATTRCVGAMPSTECPSLVLGSFVHLVIGLAILAIVALGALAASDRVARATGMRVEGRATLVALAVVAVPTAIAIVQMGIVHM